MCLRIERAALISSSRSSLVFSSRMFVFQSLVVNILSSLGGCFLKFVKLTNLGRNRSVFAYTAFSTSIQLSLYSWNPPSRALIFFMSVKPESNRGIVRDVFAS